MNDQVHSIGQIQIAGMRKIHLKIQRLGCVNIAHAAQVDHSAHIIGISGVSWFGVTTAAPVDNAVVQINLDPRLMHIAVGSMVAMRMIRMQIETR